MNKFEITKIITPTEKQVDVINDNLKKDSLKETEKITQEAKDKVNKKILDTPQKRQEEIDRVYAEAENKEKPLTSSEKNIKKRIKTDKEIREEIDKEKINDANKYFEKKRFRKEFDKLHTKEELDEIRKKPLTLSEKNQKKIDEFVDEEEKDPFEGIFSDEDEIIESTDIVKEGKKSESKEINKSVVDRFKTELNITKEDLENTENFKELSSGQQFLILENLRQIKLGRIHEDALVKSKEQMADAKFLGRIWKGISKKYQILKLEKETAKEIKEGKFESHKESLKQLVRGMKEFNIDVEMKGGHLEIQYVSESEASSKMEEGIIKEFNEVATKFARTSDEWSKETASKKDQAKYEQVKNQFTRVKENILDLKAKDIGAKESALYLSIIENNIRLNQFLNTNPEIENELKKIEDEKIWKKALKSIITERGIYAGAGFLTRTVTISAIGAIGAPLAAAGMGGFMARKRAKETLKEKEVMARKGKEDKSKEAKDFVDAEYLHESIDFLMNELGKESLTEDKKEEVMRSLKFHIQDTHNKMEDGTVNYGEKDVRLLNQYELIKKISEGAVLVEYNNVNDEAYKEDIEGIKKILKKQDKKISRAQKLYVGKKMMNGILMGAGFAATGYAIRHFGEGVGWWGDDSVRTEPKKVIEEEKLGKETVEIKGGKKISDILESKIAKKGDSSLSLAKQVYIDHAKELGYEESMGNVNKWAEKFSTRHVVGQYIREHQADYKELIDKIGNKPPKNPIELDKWMSKVPGSTFNDILNNKISNLIHVGDTVNIDKNGDINAYNLKNKLRMGQISKDILPEKEMIAPEIVSGEDYNQIMEIDDFSKFSPEQKGKIDTIFQKYLEADFENFKSFNKELQGDKIEELDELIKEFHKEKGAEGTSKARMIFLNRQLKEMYLVKSLWLKFGVEDIKVPQESIHSDEVDTGDLRGETPVGSEDNIKEIDELFEKQGMDKVIEQVRAGKFNREDFKEFLFDDARKGDDFISKKEKLNIELIMKTLDQEK